MTDSLHAHCRKGTGSMEQGTGITRGTSSLPRTETLHAREPREGKNSHTMPAKRPSSPSPVLQDARQGDDTGDHPNGPQNRAQPRQPHQGLICPTDRIQRHHQDKERKHCTVCGARIYDTVHGWMTMTRQGAQ